MVGRLRGAREESAGGGERAREEQLAPGQHWPAVAWASARALTLARSLTSRPHHSLHLCALYRQGGARGREKRKREIARELRSVLRGAGAASLLVSSLFLPGSERSIAPFQLSGCERKEQRPGRSAILPGWEGGGVRGGASCPASSCRRLSPSAAASAAENPPPSVARRPPPSGLTPCVVTAGATQDLADPSHLDADP